MSILRSKQFDDVYFSGENGLAETRHVFQAGNNLPQAWQGREEFTIAETGFGTGLNFLAVWKLWADTPVSERPQRLNFISWEKYPLSVDEIRTALEPWAGEFDGMLEGFLGAYASCRHGEEPQAMKQSINRFALHDGLLRGFAPRNDGEKRKAGDDAGSVTLTLIFGDVNEEMPKTQARVDGWFLDGFRPATNPEMWSETVFREMARMSAPGASFATFTAAGFVRRGLEAAGFTVRKARGYGRKREMLVGTYR